MTQIPMHTVIGTDANGNPVFREVVSVVGLSGDSIGGSSGGGASPSTNFTTKFREAFQALDTTDVWSMDKSSGDLVFVDGNAAGASYLVISLDPLAAGTITSIETRAAFEMPIEAAFGLHMSQRMVGQEIAVEMVSTDAPMVEEPDASIASISQTAAVLTVNTLAPHGLKPGMRFGVVGCADSRMNYPALVVATAPTEKQITATAGPAGNLPAVTAGPFTSGAIFQRSALGLATDGASMIFENAIATNASFYVRGESGDALPSGTLVGAHSTTIATTASVQAVNAALTYAFQPTSEFKLTAFVDAVQWSDMPVDTLTASTSRSKRTQVVPNPDKLYKIRIRATNNKSFGIPVGQIVSVVKTGTTTATVNFDRPHGLKTSDQIAAYGVRDTVNFPNLGVVTAISSIVNSTSITVVWGGAATATSYGGFLMRVNAGNLYAAAGSLGQVIQSASITSSVLKLTGSAAWAALQIGDLVNTIGIRNIIDGSALGIDGAWRIRNIVTTGLELEPVGWAPPSNMVTTNCGGSVLKRTDLRVSYVRALAFERSRVEIMARPTGDVAQALPVSIQGGASAVTQGGAWSLTTAGTVYPAIPQTPYFLNSAATTNGTLVAATTSGLQAFYASNMGASIAYVKLYNKATAPIVGTDIPEMIIPVPAAVAGVPGVVEIAQGFMGYRFVLGLGLAITGGVADTDTTAVAAGQVKVKLSRGV
jgi:hypothetical protein